MRPTPRNHLLLIIWMSVVLLACSLGAQEAPPTLLPRKTDIPTPQPPLSYATPQGGNVPNQSTQGAPQQTSVDVELFNLMNRIEKERLMMHIQTLVSFHTRHVNSPTQSLAHGVGAAANYISETFKQIQAQSGGKFITFEQPFIANYNGITSQQRNIIGYIQGTSAEAGIIVVGAHYDSRTNDLRDGSSFAPGADDNGSGVAAVLEIARVLSTSPMRATIVFVLFSAEEVGRQGSKAFVRDYVLVHNLPIIGMINLDTIGSNNDARGNVNDRDLRLFSAPPNSSRSRQFARTLNFIAYYHKLDLNLAMQNEIDREGRYGDHESFEEKGFPASRLIESLEDTPKREGRDTIDGIEPDYLLKSTRTVMGLLYALGGGPVPPRNIVLRDVGNGNSALVWEPVPDASRYVVGLRRPNSLIFDQYFTVIEANSGAMATVNWQVYEAVAVAAVDSRGVVGRFSEEYRIAR